MDLIFLTFGMFKVLLHAIVLNYSDPENDWSSFCAVRLYVYLRLFNSLITSSYNCRFRYNCLFQSSWSRP